MIDSIQQTQSIRRKAYTLLELLLSLALTVVVLSGISMAINVFYTTLTKQQRKIEQDLIGRAVIAMLANDLRAGLQYKAADVSGLENLITSEALIAGMLGGASSGIGDESTPPAGDEGGAAAPPAEEEPNPAEEDNAWYRPAFIGLSSQFTIDISRLPRLDQYSTLTTGMEFTATPSDIKRISWLVSLQPAVSDPNSLDVQTDSMGGLFRREVDRAVSAYRQDPDIPGAPDQYAKLLAPEVVSVQFRYFDGENWLSEWESETAGGYPLAVEIILLVDGDRNASNPAASQNKAIDMENVRQYRTVVHLPVAEIIPVEEE